MSCLHRLLGGLLFFATVLAHAADVPITLQTRTVRHLDAYRVNADGTYEETVSSEVKTLTPAGVGQARRSVVEYNRGTQRVSVIAAYTRKANGRRVDVPAANLHLDFEREAGTQVASDYTRMIVDFADVDVGDSVVIEFRLTTTQSLFPGHFSQVTTVPPRTAFDELRFRIDTPAGWFLQTAGVGMTASLDTEKDGRRVREWTYANPQPKLDPRPGVFDPRNEVALYLSTFRDYGGIARAYGERANPKAAVTPRIRKLAEEVTAGKSATRDQARALYDWVAQNIEFSGNCIGLGAVVPNDTNTILDAKTGDCKDHSTLLQALLAARGIKSSQALINAGNSYRMAQVPVVSLVNHVISYIPELDLFADSTNAEVPFGMLPFDDQDKPVLLVDGYRDGMRTPPTAPGTNRQVMKTRVQVSGDGTMTGTTEISLAGVYAAMGRSRFRNLSQRGREDFVRDMFRSGGHLGDGKFRGEDAGARAPTYSYGADFQIFGLLPLPAAGSFAVAPLIVSPAPVATFAAAAGAPAPLSEGQCSGGYSSEEYALELPQAVTVLSLPPAVQFADGSLSYSASYTLKGSVLTVTRIADDRTPGNLCSAATLAAKRAFAAKIAADVQGQVLYK
ncbi:MAG TPA: DUF3857 and transglutaminase domain-containing protein [Burkholderiales bacterium]|jgi:transglutaminase-like putative cysteine protease|nr:DUF3857 and transglutaminase domain-containing protein [Burkholderiales bacterium]